MTTPLWVIKRLIKGGVTADGVAGKDRVKVWKAKYFTKIYAHDFYGPIVGVKFSVTAPKAKSKASIKVQQWVQIRWKGELPLFGEHAAKTPREIFKSLAEDKEMQASLTTDDYYYGHALPKYYSNQLKKEIRRFRRLEKIYRRAGRAVDRPHRCRALLDHGASSEAEEMNSSAINCN